MSKYRILTHELFTLIFIWQNFNIINGKPNSCYQLAFVQATWTENRPDFLVNMTFSEQGAISSQNIVMKDIISPITYISLVQKEGNNQANIMFNVSSKLCDFLNMVNKIPALKSIANGMLKQSNYSFSCPMKQGIYVMNNMRVNNRNPFLAVMYKPKRLFNFQGGVFEELPNKTLIPLSTYNIVAKVIKRSCLRDE